MSTRRPEQREATVGRRTFLASAAAVTILPFAAHATPEALAAAIKEVTGDAPLREGRVTLDVPPLVENGNAVPLTVSIASPMTADDHVKAIHVFTEKNPQPNVASFQLGPRAGTANIQTRMRLADTQLVVAIAEMSDGTFWRDEVEVVVTMAACLEES